MQKYFRAPKCIPNLSSSIRRHLIQCDVLNHFKIPICTFPSNHKINWIALEACHCFKHINADSILKVPIFLSKIQEINASPPIPEIILALPMCMDATTLLPFHYHFRHGRPYIKNNNYNPSHQKDVSSTTISIDL